MPVLQRIGRENVLINYDTANVEFYGGVKAVDDLPEALPKLVHCHLKDKRGEGRVWDFQPSAKATSTSRAAPNHGQRRLRRTHER